MFLFSFSAMEVLTAMTATEQNPNGGWEEQGGNQENENGQ